MTSPSALNRDRALSIPSSLDALRSRIESIAQKSNARAVAVAVHDTETGAELHYEADRWFHGASTIKVAVLFALFGAVDAGRFTLDARLHVRNRFYSIVDGTPFRVSAARRSGCEIKRDSYKLFCSGSWTGAQMRALAEASPPLEV